jgi:hypothetical protein
MEKVMQAHSVRVPEGDATAVATSLIDATEATSAESSQLL